MKYPGRLKKATWRQKLMKEDIFPKPTSLIDAIKFSTAAIAIGISLFHLYTGAFGIIEAYGMRTIHLMTLMTLAFLYWPASKNGLGRNQQRSIFHWPLFALS